MTFSLISPSFCNIDNRYLNLKPIVWYLSQFYFQVFFFFLFLAQITMHILCFTPTQAKIHLFHSLNPKLKYRVTFFPWFLNQTISSKKKHAVFWIRSMMNYAIYEVLLRIRVVGFISLFYTGPSNSILDYLLLQLNKHCCVKTYWHLTIKLRTMCNSPFNNFFFLKGAVLWLLSLTLGSQWPWIRKTSRIQNSLIMNASGIRTELYYIVYKKLSDNLEYLMFFLPSREKIRTQ